MPNFRKVNGSKTYRPWKEWEVGEYLVGKYLELCEDSYGNPSYSIEAMESNVESLKEGTTIGINSCGGLNLAMEKIATGSIIRLEYEGTDVMEKGKFKGKDFHMVGVAVAEDDAEVTTPESDDDEYDI